MRSQPGGRLVGAAAGGPEPRRSEETFMIRLIINGGPGMFAIIILGLLGVATAAWFAWRAEGRVRGFLDEIGRAVVCATMVALAMDVMATLFYSVQAPPGDKPLIIMRGLGESMSPLVLGFALLSLMHLLTAIGQRRLDGRSA